MRRLAIDLHEDESGPNTVEWVLLIIVALVVLVGIYWFVNEYVFKTVDEKAKEMQEESTFEPP
jgi:hypothetical protein